MRKETFLYEIIEEYTYIASLGCTLKENYYLSDNTNDYVELIDTMKQVLDFYDEMIESNYEVVNSEIYRDSMLNLVLAELRNMTQKKIYTILEEITKDALPGKEYEFMHNSPHIYEGNNRREMSKTGLMNYINAVRQEEEQKREEV